MNYRGQDSMAFLQFKLSRGNWKTELEIAKDWANEIQKIFPQLYARIVERYKRNLQSNNPNY